MKRVTRCEEKTSVICLNSILQVTPPPFEETGVTG